MRTWPRELPSASPPGPTNSMSSNHTPPLVSASHSSATHAVALLAGATWSAMESDSQVHVAVSTVADCADERVTPSEERNSTRKRQPGPLLMPGLTHPCIE